MKLDKVPTSVVQTLKTKRDELFNQFENEPWKLSLATEIKTIDDQIAEESREKKKSRTDQAKQRAAVDLRTSAPDLKPR